MGSFAKKIGREQRRKNQKFDAIAEYSRKKGDSAKRQVMHADSRQYVIDMACRAEAIQNILTIFLASMHAEFGFGKKRLEQLDDKIYSYFNCMKRRYVKLSEMEQILSREADIHLEDDANRCASNEHYRQISKNVSDELSACFLLALLDGFGFKKKRLLAAYSAAANVASSLKKKELKLDDLKQELIKAKYLDKNGKKAA